MEKTDPQFYIASIGFQNIQVKVIERKLNAGYDQKGFQDKIFILMKACGIAKKTEVSPKDHHPPDGKGFQKEESNFAYGYILVKNSKDHLVELVYCVKSPFTLIVIPGLTRNPVFPGWIPAGVYPVLRYGAGMTASELM